MLTAKEFEKRLREELRGLKIGYQEREQLKLSLKDITPADSELNLIVKLTN